jgi:hypothetical protein
MPKNIADISRALKLKAEARPGALTLRIGVKKHKLPFEVRTVTSSDYMFVHIPPAAGLLKIEPSGLREVTSDDEAAAALASFRQNRKRRSKTAAPKVGVPPALLDALRQIPPGHRLVFDADGSPRLAKRRRKVA